MSYSVLEKYLPNDKALAYVKYWLEPYSIQLKITKERNSKLGDYQRIDRKYKHKITINYNLAPELFFLTLTHEIAHMKVYDQFTRKQALPHGKEWKSIFGAMIVESLEVYSDHLRPLLQKFAQSPKAGYYGDANMVRYFNQLHNPNQLILKDLKIGERFALKEQKFEIIQKNRTRYICKNLSTQKKYYVNHSVAIEKI